jgi:hypothetical protein
MCVCINGKLKEGIDAFPLTCIEIGWTLLKSEEMAVTMSNSVGMMVENAPGMCHYGLNKSPLDEAVWAWNGSILLTCLLVQLTPLQGLEPLLWPWSYTIAHCKVSTSQRNIDDVTMKCLSDGYPTVSVFQRGRLLPFLEFPTTLPVAIMISWLAFFGSSSLSFFQSQLQPPANLHLSLEDLGRSKVDAETHELSWTLRDVRRTRPQL